KAIPYFEQAIRLDPAYSRAYATLAMTYYRTAARDWYPILGITGLEANDRAQRNLEETQKHPTAIGHQLTGLFLLDRGSPTAALAEFKEAIALEPADSWAYVHMGLGLTGSGRPSEAIEHIGMAMRLDPHPPPVFFYYLGLAQFCEGKYDAAAASLEKVTRLNPDLEFAFIVQAATDGHL